MPVWSTRQSTFSSLLASSPLQSTQCDWNKFDFSNSVTVLIRNLSFSKGLRQKLFSPKRRHSFQIFHYTSMTYLTKRSNGNMLFSPFWGMEVLQSELPSATWTAFFFLNTAFPICTKSLVHCPGDRLLHPNHDLQKCGVPFQSIRLIAPWCYIL